jgi:hypothetical protein
MPPDGSLEQDGSSNVPCVCSPVRPFARSDHPSHTINPVTPSAYPSNLSHLSHLSHLSQTGENFHYVFKGARSAPDRASHRTGIAPREAIADWKAAQHPPVAGRPPGDPCRARRRLPSFGPSGHVGAGAHSPRGRTEPASCRNDSGGARGHGAGHPSGARIMKPCKITVKVVRPRCAAGAPP